VVIYEQHIDVLPVFVAGLTIDDQRSQPAPRHHRAAAQRRAPVIPIVMAWLRPVMTRPNA
jgi:hypothetical protein